MVSKYFQLSKKVKRIIYNTSWMLLEQFLRMFSGILVGIYMARYLGPEKFGVLSYILAITAIFVTVARMGMDSVLVRELTKNPKEKVQLLGTAFWMMMLSSFLCYFILLVINSIVSENQEIERFIIIVGGSILFTPALLIEYLYQSETRAKYSTFVKTLVLFIISVLKVVLIVGKSDLSYFVIVSLLEQALLAIFLATSFIATHRLNFLNKFKVSYAKELFDSAWPVILASLAVLVYMRIDQVMIREMLGLEEVGLYSAAGKLLSAWIVIPYIISISLLPTIVKLKQGDPKIYEERLSQLFRVTLWLCVIISLSVTFFGEDIIVFTFGESYRGSISVATLLMWSSIFVTMGSISARYFTVEKMEKKIAFRTVLSAFINVILNYLLIPIYGITGAAIATLITNFVSSYLLDWFDKDLRILLKIKHNSMLLKY